MRSTLFAAAGITAALALPLGLQAAPDASTLNPTGNATGATNPDNTANPSGMNQNNTTQNNNASTTAPSPSNNQVPGTTASNNEPNSNEHASNVIRSELERAGF